MKPWNSLLTPATILKLRIFICLMLLNCIVFAQTGPAGHPALSVTLKKGYLLVFLEKVQGANLYRQPRIKLGRTLRKIKGYDDNNVSSPVLKVSPDGSYLAMDHIIMGYVYRSEKDSVYHENYSCVIVDLKKAAVIRYLQSDCDGAWDENRKWISNANRHLPISGKHSQ
ncbi:hypothetical protein [Chitinophaga arvensicola]|nr:hypothetical protein [Chitinophaga arvensicola]